VLRPAGGDNDEATGVAKGREQTSPTDEGPERGRNTVPQESGPITTETMTPWLMQHFVERVASLCVTEMQREGG
jgi:hypothetical protein